MNVIKEKLGLISLIGAIASLVIMLAIGSTFGLIVYIISFVIAAADLYMGFKKENLTPKEFVAVAVKEQLFSVITVLAAVVVIIVFYFAAAGEAMDAAYDAYDEAMDALDDYWY